MNYKEILIINVNIYLKVLEPITLKLPENFKVIEKDYIELRRKNNSTDLLNKQDEAKQSLRLHYVKKET